MTNKKDLKILVLGYHDHTATGHTLSYYKGLKAEGFKVCHISLLAGFSHEKEGDEVKSYYKYTDKWNLHYFLSRLRRRLIVQAKRNYPALKKENCFFNLGSCFEVNAKSILRKAGFIPDIIFLGGIDYFISPKTIYDLYQLTKAKIVICMVDAHILGGGCHYPCECKQYETGCSECPAIPNKKVASSLYQEKMKYLNSIPFILVGSNYDLMRAKNVPFLQNKERMPVFNIPVIPFILKKEEARQKIGIPKNSFVILSGADSVNDIRKGFRHIIDALKIFSKNNTGQSEIVFIAMGKDDFNDELNIDKMTIVKPGFVDLELLYTYFYASDIFISASIDDSGPVMINYSIACGVPVVSFPTGVAIDLVIPSKTGYIAKQGDSYSLAEGINLFYNMLPEESEVYSLNCIETMKTLRNMYGDKAWYMKVINAMAKRECKHE